jgi:hypothetical protein
MGVSERGCSSTRFRFASGREARAASEGIFFLRARRGRVPFSAQEFPRILSAFSVNVGSVDVGIKLWKKLSTPDSPSGIRHASAVIISTRLQPRLAESNYAPSRLAIQKRSEAMLWACSEMSLSTSRRGTSASAVLSELWRTESKVSRVSVSAVAIAELIFAGSLQLWWVMKFVDKAGELWLLSGMSGMSGTVSRSSASLAASIFLVVPSALI